MASYLARLTPLALVVAVAPLFGQERLLETPYYPLQVGSRWEYKSGDQKVVVRVAGHETVEAKIDKDKKDKLVCARLEVTSGERTLTELVTVKPDGIYRVSGAGKEIVPPLCFFKTPPKRGEKWSVEGTTEGMPLKGTFTSDEAEVAVPAGKLSAVTVSSTDFQLGDKRMNLKFWFVKNVGMVKQQVKVDTFDVTLELEKYEPGKGN